MLTHGNVRFFAFYSIPVEVAVKYNKARSQLKSFYYYTVQQLYSDRSLSIDRKLLKGLLLYGPNHKILN